MFKCHVDVQSLNALLLIITWSSCDALDAYEPAHPDLIILDSPDPSSDVSIRRSISDQRRHQLGSQ